MAAILLFPMVGKLTSPMDGLEELMVTAVVLELLTPRDFFYLLLRSLPLALWLGFCCWACFKT